MTEKIIVTLYFAPQPVEQRAVSSTLSTRMQPTKTLFRWNLTKKYNVFGLDIADLRLNIRKLWTYKMTSQILYLFAKQKIQID